LINEESEKAGEIAKEVIGGIRKYKSENNLSMNTELASVKISFMEPELIEKVAEDIKQTMKVKELKAEKTNSEEIKIEIN